MGRGRKIKPWLETCTVYPHPHSPRRELIIIQTSIKVNILGASESFWVREHTCMWRRWGTVGPQVQKLLGLGLRSWSGCWSVLFNHILYNNLVNIRTASQVPLVAKSLPVDAEDTRDTDLIPGLGRSGGGRGNPRQYSCLENPMDRGAWRATNQGRKELGTQLSTHTHTHTHT